MIHKFTTILISVLGLQAIVWAHDAVTVPTEAPAGFDTPPARESLGALFLTEYLAQ